LAKSERADTASLWGTETLKDYGYKDQLQRAAVSIMNNIAEGYERRTNNDFRHFLYIAKGSSGECRSLIDLGLELGYFTSQKSKSMYELAVEIAKMISGLIKTL
jgi:four helix bundle protein